MDPTEDPPPVTIHHKHEVTGGDGEPSREQRAGTPTQSLRSKVTYYEKAWSSGQKRPGEVDEVDNFGIDVHAFEKRLKEERDRKLFEHSPHRIDIKLRPTPQSSPKDIDSPLSNIKVNIKHHIETADPNNASFNENVERVIETSGEYKRVVKYEKVITQKSMREVNIIHSHSASTSPVVRTVEFSELYGKSPSEERTLTEDSAYHSHRTHVISRSSTRTTTSKSSSSTSLHGNFPSEENVVYSRRTPSRERIFDIEPHSWSSSGSTSVVYITGNPGCVGDDTTSGVATSVIRDKAYDDDGGGNGVRVRSSSIGEHVICGSPVSSVTASNQTMPRHLTPSRERHTSEGDSNASSDWYNDYQAQSFHTVTPKMDFKRSNSRYDNHIKEIRGTNFHISLSFLLFFFLFYFRTKSNFHFLFYFLLVR